MNEIIESGRLVITPLSIEELRLFLKHKHQKWTFHHIQVNELIYDEIMAHAIKIKIQKMRLAAPTRHVWLTYWLITEKNRHEALGMIGFKHFPVNGVVEVGFGLAKKFEGNGYMTEALGGFINWAFNQNDCQKIIANTHVDNTGSQKVLEKNHFVFIRYTKQIMDFELTKTSGLTTRI